MEANEIIAIAVFAVIGLGLVGLSIPMLMGKCAGLIAGYNTMSAEEKASWDAPALARFVGKIILLCGTATGLYGVGLVCFALQWLTWAYLIVVVGLCVFAAVWCNTANRFRK